MKNTVLNYDLIECTEFKSQDYTEKQIRQILTIPELYNSDYIEYISLMDNQTIEQISYILYDTADYWDLLVVINDRDPLFDMTYEFDIIEQIAINKVDKYLANYSGMYKDGSGGVKELLNTFVLQHELDKNENNRQLKVIKKDKIYDIVKLIKELKL